MTDGAKDKGAGQMGHLLVTTATCVRRGRCAATAPSAPKPQPLLSRNAGGVGVKGVPASCESATRAMEGTLRNLA